MPAQDATKPPIPRWAWIFAAACFVIPVLPLVVRFRQPSGSLPAWTVFLFALTALQAKHPKLNPKAKEQRSQLKSKGFDTSHLDEMIDRRKERELDHFEFVKNSTRSTTSSFAKSSPKVAATTGRRGDLTGQRTLKDGRRTFRGPAA